MLGGQQPSPEYQLAVVGLWFHGENHPDLSAFTAGIYNGSGSSDLNFGASLEADGLSPEDALLLAGVDAMLARGGPGPARTTVLFCRAAGLIAAAWERFAPESANARHAGSSFSLLQSGLDHRCADRMDLSLEGNPLAAGLAQAAALLDKGVCDQVILCGAQVGQRAAALAKRAGLRINPNPRQFGLDAGAEGWTFGQGAVAVSIMRLSQARAINRPVFAVLAGVGHAAKELTAPRKHIVPTLVSADTIQQGCQRAFEAAALEPGQIAYLDWFASGFTPLDTAEINGLARIYRAAGADPGCAIGSAQSLTGFWPAAAGIAQLARVALCLHNRFIPPVPAWSGPKKADLFAELPFYAPPEPRTWFQPSADGPRLAALNHIGWDGSCCHVILSEDPLLAPRVNEFLAQAPVSLFPFAAGSLAQLLETISTARTHVSPQTHLPAFARETFDAFKRVQNPAFTACVIAQNPAELERELTFALRDIPAALEKNAPWQTPAGSCFYPSPAGAGAKIAFVYPGAFNSYLGLGRDLFTLFPRLFDLTRDLSANLGETLQERRIHPRSLSALSKDELKQAESELNADPIAMITSGSLVSVLYTLLLRDIFKITPDFSLGYSLGEIGMLFAMRVWDQADAVRSALRASPLFQQQLSGPKLAVRAHWGLPETGGAAPVWENHFLMAPVERVKEALTAEPRMYLTHVNTPRQVVVGGDPAAGARLVAALKCTTLKAPFDFTLHCEAMRAVYPALLDLLSWPVAHVPSTRLYTAAGFAPLRMERAAIAASISAMLCEPLDFPALARQVYADGARVFIELGANANCTRWIEESLKGEPVAAAAVNRKGVDDLSALVRLLARLVSNQVSLDLAPLYP